MISIIILTCNSVKYVAGCLNSVFTQEGLADSEVIIVDNGSDDGSSEFVQKNYPRAQLIKNKNNLGACKARNQALEKARGQWILTLDSDALLGKDFLKLAGEAICAIDDPRTGMLQPKVLTQGTGAIYSCGILLTKFRRFYDVGRGRPAQEAPGIAQKITGACAAAAFYRKSMLEETKDRFGYFDERFFFLAEDVDLSWRAGKKKWKAKFLPQLVCYHAGGSAAIDKKARQFLCLRNRYYAIRKNDGLARYCAMALPFLLYDLPRLLYLAAINPYVRNWIFKGKPSLPIENAG